MKTFFRLSALVLIIAFSSCKKDAEYQPVSKLSGCFVLTPVSAGDGWNPVLKQSMEEPVHIFDLGDLKNSREYYFILTNGGEEPIFDIRLSSSVSAFQITPEAIGYLPGINVVTGVISGGFIPLITLGVTHGTRLNGFGFATLLPLNLNTSLITISGKTLKNGDTIAVSETVEMRVFSRVMDIKLYDGQSEIDLSHPVGGAMFTGPMGTNNYRWYRITNNSFDVENSGNVSITISFYEQSTFINSARLEPGIRTTFWAGNLAMMNSMVLDGQGTITHPERIELFENGKGCICFWNAKK
jgi:hypothetical protein